MTTREIKKLFPDIEKTSPSAKQFVEMNGDRLKEIASTNRALFNAVSSALGWIDAKEKASGTTQPITGVIPTIIAQAPVSEQPFISWQTDMRGKRVIDLGVIVPDDVLDNYTLNYPVLDGTGKNNKFTTGTLTAMERGSGKITRLDRWQPPTDSNALYSFDLSPSGSVLSEVRDDAGKEFIDIISFWNTFTTTSAPPAPLKTLRVGDYVNGEMMSHWAYENNHVWNPDERAYGNLQPMYFTAPLKMVWVYKNNDGLTIGVFGDRTTQFFHIVIDSLPEFIDSFSYYPRTVQQINTINVNGLKEEVLGFISGQPLEADIFNEWSRGGNRWISKSGNSQIWSFNEEYMGAASGLEIHDFWMVNNLPAFRIKDQDGVAENSLYLLYGFYDFYQKKQAQPKQTITTPSKPAKQKKIKKAAVKTKIKIGDTIPMSVMKPWGEFGANGYLLGDDVWRATSFEFDGKVNDIQTIGGKLAFSWGTKNLWINLEGLDDFMANLSKGIPEEPAVIQPAISIIPTKSKIKIGQTIPRAILDAWGMSGNNTWSQGKGWFIADWYSDGIVEDIQVVDGKEAFSWGVKNRWVNMEGLDKFIEDYKSGKTSSTASAPSAPQPQMPRNTWGLKIGDEIDSKILTAWSALDGADNVYDTEDKVWETYGIAFDILEPKRTIEEFKLLRGIVGFRVTNSFGLFLRAQGFKEFMDNYKSTVPAKPAAKKRGRPAKIKPTQITSIPSQPAPPQIIAKTSRAEEAPAPKKRGRPKKVDAKVKEALDLDITDIEI